MKETVSVCLHSMAKAISRALQRWFLLATSVFFVFLLVSRKSSNLEADVFLHEEAVHQLRDMEDPATIREESKQDENELEVVKLSSKAMLVQWVDRFNIKKTPITTTNPLKTKKTLIPHAKMTFQSNPRNSIPPKPTFYDKGEPSPPTSTPRPTENHYKHLALRHQMALYIQSLTPNFLCPSEERIGGLHDGGKWM